MAAEGSVDVLLRIPASLKERVQKAASGSNRSMNKWFINAAEEALAHRHGPACTQGPSGWVCPIEPEGEK
jgi:hypothetical protein